MRAARTGQRASKAPKVARAALQASPGRALSAAAESMGISEHGSNGPAAIGTAAAADAPKVLLDGWNAPDGADDAIEMTDIDEPVYGELRAIFARTVQSGQWGPNAVSVYKLMAEAGYNEQRTLTMVQKLECMCVIETTQVGDDATECLQVMVAPTPRSP